MNAVSTIASIPAILALVNLLKGLGLSGRWSALVAVALGVAIAASGHLFAASGLYQACSQGLLLGLGAAGLYDASASRTVTR